MKVPVKETSKRKLTQLRIGQDSSSSSEHKNAPRTATKSDFEIIRPIGKGSFGEVSLVRHVQTRQTYAMKVSTPLNTELLMCTRSIMER